MRTVIKNQPKLHPLTKVHRLSLPNLKICGPDTLRSLKSPDGLGKKEVQKVKIVSKIKEGMFKTAKKIAA